MQRELLIITATVITLGTVLSAPTEPEARPVAIINDTAAQSSHQQYITKSPRICTQSSILLVDFGHAIDANGNFVSTPLKTPSVSL